MDNIKKMMSEDFLNGIKFMGGFDCKGVVMENDSDTNDDDSDTSENSEYEGYDPSDTSEIEDNNENKPSSPKNASLRTESSSEKKSSSFEKTSPKTEPSSSKEASLKKERCLKTDSSSLEKEDALLENDHCVDDRLKSNNFSENVKSSKSCSESLKSYYKSQYSDVLNVQIVEKLENDLNFYEKISIVFLVYEDSQLEYALQRLTVACKDNLKSSNLLTDWCLAKPKFWREKLLQALVIIKNFYVMSKLGYKKNDAKCLFRKKNYIPSIRKQIYNFCESLSIEESKCLINEVNNELKTKKVYDNNNDIVDCDPKYLELSFLFWLSRKFISFQSKNVNLINLIECLDDSNDLNKGCIKKRLQIINDVYNKPKDKTKKSSNQKTNKIENMTENSNCDSETCSAKNNFDESEDNSLSSISTTITASSVSNNWSGEFHHLEPFSNSYEIINPNEGGLVIIVNQKNFENREQDPRFKAYLSKDILPNRDGTDADAERIRSTFTNLGYKVIIFNDLTHIDLFNYIKAAVKQRFNPNEHSSIFLFMLTHGFQGHVFACNSIQLSIESIKKILWGCDCLIGKPKGIIIQACQGNVPQEVLVTDGPAESTMQGQCDLFLGLATVSGHVAFRHMKSGTWFIQILCQCIEEYAFTTDFAKIFTRVNEKISKMRAFDVTGTHVYGQISECRSSLRFEWYLVPPKRSAAIPIKSISP